MTGKLRWKIQETQGRVRAAKPPSFRITCNQVYQWEADFMKSLMDILKLPNGRVLIEIHVRELHSRSLAFVAQKLFVLNIKNIRD